MEFASHVKTPLSKRPQTESEWAAIRELMEQGPRTKLDFPEFMPYLHARFEYDPATGILSWWLMEPDQRDRIATRPGQNGFGMVRINQIMVPSAHLVWLLHHGRWPIGRLKRRNGRIEDDRIENLYEPFGSAAPRPEVFGGKVRKNKSRGVSRCGSDWQAYVRVDGWQKNLGRFRTEAEALAARAAWDAEHAADDLV